MVKFSKQLELQLVPEWKHAFCNYWKLKKDLKRIKQEHLHRNDGHGHHHDHHSLSSDHLDLPSTSHFSTSGLTQRRPTSSSNPTSDRDSVGQDVIKVHNRKSHCSSSTSHESISVVETYETELFGPLRGNEHEIIFFKGVDNELNKVNGFYASMEDEFSRKMEELKHQLVQLISLRKALDEQLRGNDECPSQSPSTKPLLQSPNKSSSKCDAISTNGKSSYDEEKELGHINLQTNNDKHFDHLNSNLNHEKSQFSHINLHMPTNVLTSTISTLMANNILWKPHDRYQTKKLSLHQNGSYTPTSVTQRQFRYARKMVRLAFVEYYRGLGLLKRFRSLNMLAFGKILKKYDKVTGRNASSPYLKALERSRLNNSNKVDQLMEEVERSFTQYFAKNDSKKAMILLRPEQKKVCHTTTYFVGLFSGWSISFLVAFIILLHSNDRYFMNSKLQNYADKIYPVYSTFFLIVFHIFMYGWNIHLWQQVRINYPFIFEFAPSTELRTREILLVCTCLTTLGIASMVSHLIVYLSGSKFIDPSSIPFATILVSFIFLLCPLNIFHRSSRCYFLRSIKRIILAPFYKVSMVDFFLADQLTSQVSAIRQTQYIICYYFGGQVLSHVTHVCGGPKYHQFAYILSFLPYWWRLLQCLRRWNDEGDRVHLANGGKYLSAMVAVGCRLTFQYYPSMAWLVIFVVASCLATMYQMYWDLIMDWGLLQRHSKNPWLRDQLVLKNKSIYFFSMGLNCLLRFAWVQSLVHFPNGENNHYLTDFFFALMEVFRRGHWNFYRLENEHLNNVGKFRAVKTVPLPFRDDFVRSI